MGTSITDIVTRSHQPSMVNLFWATSLQRFSGVFLVVAKAVPIIPSASWRFLCSISSTELGADHWLWAQSDRDTIGLGDLWVGRLHVIWHLSHSHLLQDPWVADLSVCVLGLTWHVHKWDRETEKGKKPALPHYTYDGSVRGGEKWTNQPLQWWNLTQFISKLTGVG